MSFGEKVGDFFNGITAGFEKLLTKIFGSSNERQIKRMGYVRDKDGSASVVSGTALEKINAFEPEWESKSDDDLNQSAASWRERFRNGESLDDLLPEVFAAVRESGKRNLKMRHYDVQMIGGMILHSGRIAEMVTGEGKTLVATLPAVLNAIAGHVHVVTVNDYLAKRDMEWMAPVYQSLGFTVGAIQSNMGTWGEGAEERRAQYNCDICYGTNNEFGFDYLRDNMKTRKEDQCQGPLDFAIVDEIDNILIDEARTPLIISGGTDDDAGKYMKADKLARQLKKDVDFEFKEKEHTCHLTDEGIRKAERLAGVESFYTAGNMHWPHLIDNSLKAHHLYKKDVHYLVQEGEIIIIDESTGRKMEGRQWSDGLHQAVEAKERVKIKEETQTLATITLQNFFKLYGKLAGMTGTAMTEAGEFIKIYKLDVVAVPTNKPLARINHPDRVFLTHEAKWKAIIEEIKEVHETGRPVLVGTVSVEDSEYLSNRLTKVGVKHEVLNAKFVEREADIIAQAGRKSAVTIATNMAGRGTDIVLGGNPENRAWEILKKKYNSRLEVPKAEWEEVTKQIADEEGMAVEGREIAELGGLHVVGTERHDSRRIDLQLRGRAGRQGDNGSSRFSISLEDTLLRLFGGERMKKIMEWGGMKADEYIESKMLTRRVEGAQKKREETHFDQRKNLLEYDEVMDQQRKQVYSYRQDILDGINCRSKIEEMTADLLAKYVPEYWDRLYRWNMVATYCGQHFRVSVDAPTLFGMEREQIHQYLRDESLSQADELLHEQIEENLPEDAEDQSEWNWQALSKWVNRQFGLNTNVSELKKIGRDQLHHDLYQRAAETINKMEYDGLDPFLDDDFQLNALMGWVQYQFNIDIPIEELREYDQEEQVIAYLQGKVESVYHEKEIRFPVAVGLSRYRDPTSSGGEKFDREGLASWASSRFATSVEVGNLKGKPASEMEDLLAGESRQYFINGDVTEKVDDYLDQAYDGSPFPKDDPQAAAALGQLAHWAKEEFKAELEPSDFEALSRTEAKQKVLKEYDSRYRPELSHVERVVILELLDTAWKDHLYHMDQVRGSIGLVGYAQRDAKTEYKKEGVEAFNQMWERLGEQVVATVFRIEQDSPEYVGSLTEVSFVKDQAVDPQFEAPEGIGPQGDQVVEPIRNAEPKVGRNDPCPCGSGKKYKKCHGAA